MIFPRARGSRSEPADLGIRTRDFVGAQLIGTDPQGFRSGDSPLRAPEAGSLGPRTVVLGRSPDLLVLHQNPLQRAALKSPAVPSAAM